MNSAPVCPECGSADVFVGDAIAACNRCSYWGASQHFFTTSPPLYSGCCRQWSWGGVYCEACPDLAVAA